MAQLELENRQQVVQGTARCSTACRSTVETGEIVVMFGPSGTGKTVLLRLIAGVDEPDARRRSASTAAT